MKKYNPKEFSQLEKSFSLLWSKSKLQMLVLYNFVSYSGIMSQSDHLSDFFNQFRPWQTMHDVKSAGMTFIANVQATKVFDTNWVIVNVPEQKFSNLRITNKVLPLDFSNLSKTMMVRYRVTEYLQLQEAKFHKHGVKLLLLTPCTPDLLQPD